MKIQKMIRRGYLSVEKHKRDSYLVDCLCKAVIIVVAGVAVLAVINIAIAILTVLIP
jgi:hypothetical protein